MSDVKKNETARQSKSAAAIAALDAAEQGTKKPAKKPAKKKPKPKEKVSTRGTANTDINAGAERLMQPMREQLRAAVLTGNKNKAKSLRQRLLAVQSTKL